MALGRRTEAIEQVERAVQGDPLHLTIRSVMADCLAAAGRYTEAEAHLRLRSWIWSQTPLWLTALATTLPAACLSKRYL